MTALPYPALKPVALSAPDRPLRLRLWLPLTLLLIVLSPLLLIVFGAGACLLWPLGVNPVRALTGVARVLLALGGTDVQVEAPHASNLLKIR